MCDGSESILTTRRSSALCPNQPPLFFLPLRFTSPSPPPLSVLDNAKVVLPVSVSPHPPQGRCRTSTADARRLIPPVRYPVRIRKIVSVVRIYHGLSLPLPYHIPPCSTLPLQITYHRSGLLMSSFAAHLQKCDRKLPQCTACQKSRRGLECNFNAGHVIPQPRPKSLPKGEACAPCR